MSLEPVRDGVDLRLPPTGTPGWTTFLLVMGPAYLVAVGYMDPGNWVGDIAGGSAYAVNGMPKVVLYWHMALQEQGPVQDTREVADLRWVSVDEALSLLTHANERSLLAPLENRERPGR